jgi:formiminoglutamase
VVVSATTQLPNDPRWPRAGTWLAGGSELPVVEFGVMGAPTSALSISPSGTHETPDAIRSALYRYSTFHASSGIDLASLSVQDFGCSVSPSNPEVTTTFAAECAAKAHFLTILGGDNSITYAGVRGVFGIGLGQTGIITFDAHHDLRDGVSNGSPIRQLVEAGAKGARIVQIGIADFANSAEYSARAHDLGITVISRASMRRRPMSDVVAEALEIAGTGNAGIYVDVDVDVCDRSVAPGCRASVPGGLSADELREGVYLVARDPRVRALDITEVDSTADAADQRTVQLAALCVLEAAAGFASRR